MDFAEVVRGKKGEEVARFFLSTLMLANTENVKISTKTGTDPQLGKMFNDDFHIFTVVLSRNGQRAANSVEPHQASRTVGRV